VPLVFEIAFVLVLNNMLQQAEIEVAREEHARAIIKHLNNLHICIMGSAGGMVAYMLSGNPTNLRHALSNSAPISSELAALSELCSDHSLETRAIRQIQKLTTETEDVVRKIHALAEQNGGQPDVEQLNALRNHINYLRGEADKIADAESEIEKLSPKLQAESRQKVREILVIGVALNVFLAVGLALFFNRSTSKRLAILMDNTYRLAAGRDLNPPIRGGDEIAHLDHTFQRMAKLLAEASRKDKEAEANLRRILESMPLGLLVLDEDGKIELANPTIESMFLKDVSKVQGTSLQTLITSIPDKEIKPFIDKLCEKSNHKPEDLEAKKSNGQDFPIEISMTRFETFKGKRILVIILDVTERWEIEKMKRELVSIVSHELRTPLTSIQGFLTLLGENVYGDLTEQGQRRVALADRNVEHLVKLVNDLLAVEKLESGRVELTIREVKMSTLMERCLEGVNQLAKSRNVSIEPPSDDVTLTADEDRITQVLINLVSNAIKYSPEGDSVTVSARNGADGVEVRVCDHGCGIPLSAQKRIFERFQQVNASEDERKGGTGLGLAICKAIIEQHNGVIGVDSAEGSGSTFWFRIPAAAKT
jgi:PAS domain S-box-containing protein